MIIIIQRPGLLNMGKLRNYNKNKLLEKHKKLFAQKRGYKSFNEYRQHRNLYDYIGDLHEIAANAIDELQAEIKRIKEIADLR